MLGILDRADLAERVMDRILLVSGSRGAEVGPGSLVVVLVDVGADPDVDDESGRPLPIRNESVGLSFV